MGTHERKKTLIESKRGISTKVTTSRLVDEDQEERENPHEY
jgi:hypothetical protein